MEEYQESDPQELILSGVVGRIAVRTGRREFNLLNELDYNLKSVFEEIIRERHFEETENRAVKESIHRIA